MARDKGEDPRRRRGRGDEGPSDEDLGWLADLRGSGGREDPFVDAPRSRRGGSDEPPTGAVPRGTPPPGPGGAGNRPVRRTPPLPPVSPAGPSSPAAPPPSSPAPSWQEPPTSAPTRGGIRRTPATPPPAPPAVPPLPTPAARGAGPRPMIDWSDLTGELPAASAPPRPPAPPLPVPPPAGPTGRPGPTALAAGPGATGLLRPGQPGPGPGAPGGPGPAGPAAPKPGGPGPVGPKPIGVPTSDPMVTTGMIRRAELRKHMRVQQQLKTLTLVLVVLLMLAAYPVYLFAHALAADPVFSGLDRLNLPSWAAYEHADHDEGSRWCIGRCKVRTRTWLSERGPDETSGVYATALTGDGWRANAEGCPQSTADNLLSCWQKDEYRMQMQIRAPLCEAPPTRAPVPGATATEQAGPADTKPVCPGALVTMYVFNATDYQPVLTS